MYRDYENPLALEEQLKSLQTEYQKTKEDYLRNKAENYLLHCRLTDLYDSIINLKERINFAWQDLYEDDI